MESLIYLVRHGEIEHTALRSSSVGPTRRSVWNALGLDTIVSWFVGHDIEVTLEFSLLDSYAGLMQAPSFAAQ